MQPFPGPGGKWQVSTDGGSEAVWNPNGKEIFYRNGNKMMAVAVTTEPTFSVGKATMLFEGDFGNQTLANIRNYDVSSDGLRFLMFKPTDHGAQFAPTQINIVLNWFEELKGFVPTN